MRVNDVVAFILRFAANLIALLASYVTVVEDRPIMSVNIVFQFQTSTFGYNYPTLQRGLSAIAELLVVSTLRLSHDVKYKPIYLQ